MAGLSSVNETRATYLSTAGGYLWDRKQDSSHPNYFEQEYERKDGTKGVRKGARYGALTGKIVDVTFRSHNEYGDSVNVGFTAAGEKYILSISLGNKPAQDMLRALLVIDYDKDVNVKPYDFIGQDKKRAQGLIFKQDGKKLDLVIKDAPTKSKDWFKSASKKDIRRFFEDLAEWLQAEIEEKIQPMLDAKPKEELEPQGLGQAASSKPEVDEAPETKQEQPEEQPDEEPKEKVKKEAKEPTPLQKRKFLRAYIKENYEGEKLPKLDAEELDKWYKLAQEDEELPFDEDDSIPSSELDDQLAKLGM